MPGFFESLKRMAQGKPVFDEGDQKNGWVNKDGTQKEPQLAPASAAKAPEAQTHPEGSGTGVIKGDSSTFPVVYVKHSRTQLNDSNQDVYCSIVNSSRGVIELDEIELLGQSRHLGGTLRPGEEREYLAYSGPRHTDGGDREAHLNYKDETGDYFQSVYDVKYRYENDKTYSVDEIHLRLPIKDIYG